MPRVLHTGVVVSIPTFDLRTETLLPSMSNLRFLSLLASSTLHQTGTLKNEDLERD